MALDPELKDVARRYTIVGVVLAAAVIWTVYYVKDNAHENGAPLMVGSDAGPEKRTEEQKAPSVKDMFVGERVSCAAACRLENYCGLRSIDDCLKSSCDGALRKDIKSDADFARADDCVKASQAPCAEACFRRGECKKDHSDDSRCIESCNLKPDYRASRCVLEMNTCDDVTAKCAATF